MKYSELNELITPYFLSRGGGTMSNAQTKRNYVCIAITDIFNYANWSDLYMEEDIEGILNGSYYEYKSTYEIGNVFQIAELTDLGEVGRELIATVGAARLLELNIGKKVITSDDTIKKIRIGYYKGYEWYQLTNEDIPIPLGTKFIPALINLIYDYASPINAFEGEGQINRRSLAEQQLQQLKQRDGITSNVQIIPPKAEY